MKLVCSFWNENTTSIICLRPVSLGGQYVLWRETGMSQPAIAQVTGASLSTVNRTHIACSHGGIKALNEPRPVAETGVASVSRSSSVRSGSEARPACAREGKSL
jgi:hypothetical protein